MRCKLNTLVLLNRYYDLTNDEFSYQNYQSFINVVQSKSIFWRVLDLQRFTLKIRIVFYIGVYSSNFLSFIVYGCAFKIVT